MKTLDLSLFPFGFSLESEVRCSDNDRQLDMTQWAHITENVIDNIKTYLKRRRPDVAPQARSRRNPEENCRRTTLSVDGEYVWCA
jgi:hypothetical protein